MEANQRSSESDGGSESDSHHFGLEIAMTIDMIKENPTSVKTDKVLDALEKYLKALADRHEHLIREMPKDRWGI